MKRPTTTTSKKRRRRPTTLEIETAVATQILALLRPFAPADRQRILNAVSILLEIAP